MKVLQIMDNFNNQSYEQMLEDLFKRFPSFQNAGASAYKPGLDNVEFLDQMMGHPHRRYKTVHIAGTNGKGSVSNMLASVLAGRGLKVGLYTSPHILDFRERMRVIDDNGYSLISQKEVWDFVQNWNPTFEHLGTSFFEITTMMAFDWFAKQKVDIAVIETGLGGRLDSTNIITPVLSIITNIGLDHCDLLGNTLPEIAFEKAGIIKPGVPAVIGESDPQTTLVFDRKFRYSNLNGNDSTATLTYADKTEPSLWDRHEEILAGMDLQGPCQNKNLRTVLTALDIMKMANANVVEPLMHTALRCGFHGRWEKLMDEPLVICDIGHNAHGLKLNFERLAAMERDLVMVYGSVSDKDVDAVLRLFPQKVTIVFTNAASHRSMPASELMARYGSIFSENNNIYCVPNVADALEKALSLARNLQGPLVYVGGSTYVVAEAVKSLL